MNALPAASSFSMFSVILILLAAAVVVAGIFRRLKLPEIIGYIAVGMLLGPYALGIINNSDEIKELAEFGIVFLLFTIGLEFSLTRLMTMRTTAVIYGGLQILLTLLVTAGIALALGFKPATALIIGSLAAMSSTAIVLKQLSQQLELTSQHGINATGILLMQDLAVIPLLILVSRLGKNTESSLILDIAIALAKSVLSFVLIVAIERYLLRPLFRRIAASRSSELFTLTTLLVTLSCAWLTQHLGLSLALGAFIAGLMLSETEFRHQIEIEIRPFRDVLLGLFFISIGMQFDLEALPYIWPWIIALLADLLILKMLLVIGLGLLLKHDKITSLRTGLVLAQGGEFGFALLLVALNARIISPLYGQALLGAILLSMLISTLIIRFNGSIAAWFLPQTAQQSEKEIRARIIEISAELHHHVIICGYGRVGQNLGRLLKAANLPYIALDTDISKVQSAYLAGENVAWGDASRYDILKLAGIDQAQALAICLNNYDQAIPIIEQVRHAHPKIHILVRSYHFNDLEIFKQKGADYVIPETLELSLVFGSQLLTLMGLPETKVREIIEENRKKHYPSL